MNAVNNPWIKFLALLLLFVGIVGCDVLEDRFENDKEADGIVEVIDGNALTVDGIVYEVTDQTEFDGLSGLSDLAVGDEVEIEYEENGSTRIAIEIERGGDD